MQAKMLLEYASIAQFALCISVLFLLWRKRSLPDFSWLAAFAAVKLLHLSITIPLLFFRRELGIPLSIGYAAYFYSYWGDFVLEAVLSVALLYAIYRLAMKPLQGLQRFGSVIFKWVLVVSGIVTASSAIVPHDGGNSAYLILCERSQQGTNVLTLCLLLFVCFAIRPLGLTYRSRIFGVTLGLGVLATVSLVQAAWYSTTAAISVYSPVYVFGAFGSVAALMVWGVYFAMPEPERKMVMLPTTSPFFVWNRIAEALGDPSGSVVLSGFGPDRMQPAELKVLALSSKMARERQKRLEAELAFTASESALDPSQSFHSVGMRR